ncbi:MAG TPA: PAS domain S-box protein [Sphingomicrobium sp.]
MNNDARSDNAFERDMPGTNARTQAEAAIEQLRQRGGIFVEAVRATRMPMALTDPNLPGNPIVFANASFLKLSGYSMEEVLGQQPHFMNGSGTDPKDAARFAEAIRSDQDDIIETVQYSKDGSRFVATVLISAFKDEQGRVLNHFMSWLDVTRRVDAESEVVDLKATQAALRASEEALRASEERHSFLLALGDAMRAETTADSKIVVASRMLGKKLSASRVLFAEYDHEKGLAHIFNGWLADGAEPFASVLKLEDFEGDVLNDLREGRLVRVDDVGRRSAESGYAVIANVGVQALLSPPLLIDGKLKFNVSIHQHEPRHWTDDEVALVQEVSERLWSEVVRTRAEEAMRDSEEQLRLIVESAKDYAIFTTDLDNRITTWLPGAENVFGWTPEEAIGEPVDITFTPEDREKNEPNKEAEEARRTGTAPNVRWHVCKDGRRVFIDGHVVALRNEKGEVDGLLKIGQDTTEKHRAREHERMLVAELQHRVRNTLAVIRSIVRRTANTADSVEEFEQNLDGRLSSFARTQAYVTRDFEGSMDLEMIVRDELLAHAAGDSEQVSIEGPPVRLTPKQAETISLAMHELASNAMKHGALAGEGNRVDVKWSLEGDGEGRRLHLSWLETLNDRTLETPQRSGFGTELLEKVMSYELDAEPEIEFRPNGLSYRVVIPLSIGVPSR